MKQDSILESLYYGGINPCEGRIAQTKQYQTQAKKSCDLYGGVCALLNTDGQKQLEEFLSENGKLAAYFEEEKFKDGFILGARLMIETLTDTRFME